MDINIHKTKIVDATSPMIRGISPSEVNAAIINIPNGETHPNISNAMGAARNFTDSLLIKNGNS
jgi:hypothetical protein